jgi:hypothetical protein
VVRKFETVVRNITSVGTFPSLVAYLLPLVLLVMLPTGKFDSNEEQYFQLAYRLLAPEAFSPYSAVFDRASGRAASYYLIGSAVAAFGYDGAHIVLRVLNSLLYAVGFAALFSALRLSAVDSAFALAVFYLADEGLFGGEWLLRGTEPKTLAYPLILVGLGLGFRNRWGSALPCFVGATYLHFLVGGFWSVAALFYQWLAMRQLKTTILTALTYMALSVPLAVSLLVDQRGEDVVAAALGQGADYLYAFRNAHHVLPFASTRRFLVDWSTPILASIALTAVLVMLIRRSTGTSRTLLVLVVCLLGYLFAALVASAFDRTGGRLGKFYLFRPASLTLLLAIVASLRSVNDWRNEAPQFVKRAVAIIVIPLFLWSAAKVKLEQIYWPEIPRREVQELKSHIHARSRPDQIVLIEPVRTVWGVAVALPRLLERPTLVSWKFVPSNPHDIQRWSGLLRYTEELFARGCREPLEFDVAFLVVLSEARLQAVQSCGEVTYQTNRFTLIRIAGK